jgi:hypothetical protein
MRKTRLLVIGMLLLVAAAGCGKKEEEPKPVAPAPAPEPPAPAPAPAGVSAGSIDLGKAVGADKKVTTPAETFAKGDTIYASIDTTGTGSATLKAKWTYEKGGQTTVVKEDSQEITPTGPATTEFHISKPGGWPAGDYQVELFLDGKSVGMKKFKVG